MDADLESSDASSPGCAGKTAAQAMDEETRALFERGVMALREERAAEAVAALRRATVLAPDHAQIRSFLGLAIALAEGNFAEARVLCEGAVRQEFFSPEVYLNLAKVYLRFGRRAEALRYLRRGQMIDPGHVPIKQLIAALGRRRLPILPFLPRRHPINRALGSVRTRFVEVFSRG